MLTRRTMGKLSWDTEMCYDEVLKDSTRETKNSGDNKDDKETGEDIPCVEIDILKIQLKVWFRGKD